MAIGDTMNTKPFEAKYELFGSIEEMLALEILSKLLSKPVRRVECAGYRKYT